MAFVTASWNPLGDAFYRKSELYEMSWSLKDGLRDSLVAAAPYGGPIAVLKEPQRRSPSSRPHLDIYSASGQTLASFTWKSGVVLQLGWSVSDELLCVQEDGTVLIYDLFGSFKRHFSMGQEITHDQVVQARVFHSPFGTGVAVVTASARFTLATNIDDLKLRRLPEVPGLQGAPSSWAILTQERQTKVLLSIGPELYVLDHTSFSPQYPPGLSPDSGSILQMCVSFSYKYLALFTESGLVWTGTSSLQEKFSEVDTKMRSAPKQMVCRVFPFSEVLVLIQFRFPLDQVSVLVPELDGIRVLGGFHQELLQEVPLVSQEIFKIASMSPGALLLEAHREYEKQSQRADEYLREIKEQSVLSEAVAQCVEAAAHEWDCTTQKALLRAASFGKCFLSDFSPESFVSICRELRVLNAVRESTVGIPLTHTQFKQMTVQVLIDRLVHRRLYPLAMEICRYLKIPEFQGVSRVLRHWASCKVQQTDLSDEAVARVVCAKVGDTPGVSYSHIAAKAYESGRPELAIKLLEFEARSGEQVPLLLKMKRSHLALSKAVESGDTDLVFTVVTFLKNEMNRGDFFMTLRNQPLALSLYRQRLEGRVAALQNAVDEFNKAKNDFNAKATEEEMKLLRFQKKLDEEKGAGPGAVSVQDTMETLLNLGLHKQAEQLYRDFRVPDKRFWWLKLRALAEKQDWDELDKFSRSKKSPIGYLPFVDVCVKNHNQHEAKKYLLRVSPEQRVQACLLLGDLEGAADAAIERRNAEPMPCLQPPTDGTTPARHSQEVTFSCLLLSAPICSFTCVDLLYEISL
uniref:Vacuolar protein sorting-associated protein 16 homolog n=1 Tax=Periophthalmus magnuspinnatus TaxID=409849 RepID=A0A3B3ZYC1_9GOBI